MIRLLKSLVIFTFIFLLKFLQYLLTVIPASVVDAYDAAKKPWNKVTGFSDQNWNNGYRKHHSRRGHRGGRKHSKRHRQ